MCEHENVGDNPKPYGRQGWALKRITSEHTYKMNRRFVSPMATLGRQGVLNVWTRKTVKNIYTGSLCL